MYIMVSLILLCSDGVFMRFCSFPVLCMLRTAAKRGSETVTFSLLVNTAAISETSTESEPSEGIFTYQ